MIAQLAQMLSLQDKMNTQVHPQWRLQGYPWHRAIWTECAELMDHHGWKWWKQQAPDMHQIKLELVDIWHFGLSIRLQETENIEQTAHSIALDWSQHTPTQSCDFLSTIEAIAEHALREKSLSLPLFIDLMEEANMDIDELTRQYVGKNVLNVFRQNNGYKTGRYQKEWRGREDNEVLVEVLENLDPASESFAEYVYNELENQYPG